MFNNSALHLFQARIEARLPSIVVFFRGERSFFCKQWLRRWLSIRGLSPRLRQLNVALIFVSSQSQGKAFSVADQLARNRNDLRENVFFFGDPENALVHYLRHNSIPAPVVTNPELHRAHGWLFEHGMVQPAVLAIFEHTVLYQWCSRPSFLNGAGKLDRPDPWQIWDTIESEMERTINTNSIPVRIPLQCPSETSHTSARVTGPSTSATAETPQSPVLSELKSPEHTPKSYSNQSSSHPIHVVEAKMLPTPSTMHTQTSTEHSSSPEQLAATMRRLSSTVNALSSDAPKLLPHSDANDVIDLPHILQHVFSSTTNINLESMQPQSPQSNELHLRSSSWYDRPDTELNASHGKLHQFSAEHTPISESAAWDRLQLFGRLQGSQSSLHSSTSSDHRSSEPQLTSPEKLEARLGAYLLNDEYASSEMEAISIKDIKEAHENDEHQYSQLFTRVSTAERQSANRSFRGLFSAESQPLSPSDLREPLEGSNTSLGSDVVDSLVRKVRSVRTSDSTLMTHFREGISFPSIRIDEEGESTETGVFDILKELSDHVNIQERQERRDSKTSLKSTPVRPPSYVADSRPEISSRSLDRGTVDATYLTSSFRNVPKVGIRDYSGASSIDPFASRRDRTTKGIIPELGAVQPNTNNPGSLVSEDVPPAFAMHHNQSDLMPYAQSLQSDVSPECKAPVVDLDSPRKSEERRTDSHIHDEYEAYDEFLVAEYEVEERVEEHQSGTSKAESQRGRPLSIDPHRLWGKEEREDLRPIKSETSPLDTALSKFSNSRRTDGGAKTAFGLLRRSVRYDDGDRPRRLDSLKAMVRGRKRVTYSEDEREVLRLASGPTSGGGLNNLGTSDQRENKARRGRVSQAVGKGARGERRWWGRRREGDGEGQREKGLVVTASMAAFLRSRRKAR
ncbi:unnamed protein product [Agarophyton chilense]|eukprot:gb/GEZJ01005221.1/.p1 GENE.gb/GEZJ01005221.1/~~gb/GEZJ01005221.1/.p1  ORF type:complete len:940 (+),score=118.30 gb/GEZJ01005221.1/:95-2821(+)